MGQKTFAVLGGDLRQYWAARGLEALGYRTRCYAVPDPAHGVPRTQTLEEALSNAEFVILPVPAFRGDGTLNAQGTPVDRAALLEAISPGAWVFGGKLGAWAADAGERGLHPVDYLALEEMAVANAIPAAAAMLPRTIGLSNGRSYLRCFIFYKVITQSGEKINP